MLSIVWVNITHVHNLEVHQVATLISSDGNILKRWNIRCYSNYIHIFGYFAGIF